jgi:hypothetical protein
MYAKIVAPGFTYQLTANDVLWAGRMADGEGDSDARKVLWTMSQRFAGLVRRGSFASFVRAYSQPINPKWQRDGICCAQGATGCPARRSRSFYGEEPCSESRLARRDRMSTIPWDRLPAGVRRDVLAWAKAKAPNPVPHAVDFAAPGLSSRKLARASLGLSLVTRGRNWFLANRTSRAWSRNHVTLQLNGRVAKAGGGGLLLLGTLGLAAWAGVRTAQGRSLVPDALRR